jgi:hypothetical protein
MREKEKKIILYDLNIRNYLRKISEIWILTLGTY